MQQARERSSGYRLGWRLGQAWKWQRRWEGRVVERLAGPGATPCRLGTWKAVVRVLKLLVLGLIAWQGVMLAAMALMVYLAPLIAPWNIYANAPGIDEFDHPDHRTYWSELYDEWGSLK